MLMVMIIMAMVNMTMLVHGDDHGGDDEHKCTDCDDNCDDDVEENFAGGASGEGT